MGGGVVELRALPLGTAVRGLCPMSGLALASAGYGRAGAGARTEMPCDGALAGNEPEPSGRLKGQRQTPQSFKARCVPMAHVEGCLPSHAASFGRSSFRPTNLPAQDGNPTRQHNSHLFWSNPAKP
jgi:hypothetical protein